MLPPGAPQKELPLYVKPDYCVAYSIVENKDVYPLTSVNYFNSAGDQRRFWIQSAASDALPDGHANKKILEISIDDLWAYQAFQNDIDFTYADGPNLDIQVSYEQKYLKVIAPTGTTPEQFKSEIEKNPYKNFLNVEILTGSDTRPGADGKPPIFKESVPFDQRSSVGDLIYSGSYDIPKGMRPGWCWLEISCGIDTRDAVLGEAQIYIGNIHDAESHTQSCLVTTFPTWHLMSPEDYLFLSTTTSSPNSFNVYFRIWKIPYDPSVSDYTRIIA